MGSGPEFRARLGVTAGPGLRVGLGRRLGQIVRIRSEPAGRGRVRTIFGSVDPGIDTVFVTSRRYRQTNFA